jgi:hypothetical protein
MRSKAFIIGFIIGVGLLVAANIHSYLHMEFSGGGGCDDCTFSFGFPFPLWVEGGFISVADVLWGGLVADAAVAVGVGLLLGVTLTAAAAARRRLR